MAAFADFTVNFHESAVDFGQLFHDGESDAGPAAFFIPGFVQRLLCTRRVHGELADYERFFLIGSLPASRQDLFAAALTIRQEPMPSPGNV